MFKILVVGGPAEKYVERCMESILAQKEEFTAQVVLDPVGDNTYNLAKKYECEKLKVSINDKQMFAIPNLIKAVNLSNCADEDIIVTVDADDWFSSDICLSVVKRYYDVFKDLLVTYGSWIGYPNPNCQTNCVSYLKHEFDSGIRNHAWKGTHLRTLKYKIWKRIQDKDFRGQNGEYLKTAWDMAFMIPALEMAGFYRSRFIQEKLYVYNKETPFNDEKIRYEEQIADADCVYKKNKYEYVNF
jgi:hypothetical protein